MPTLPLSGLFPGGANTAASTNNDVAGTGGILGAEHNAGNEENAFVNILGQQQVAADSHSVRASSTTGPSPKALVLDLEIPVELSIDLDGAVTILPEAMAQESVALSLSTDLGAVSAKSVPGFASGLTHEELAALTAENSTVNLTAAASFFANRLGTASLSNNSAGVLERASVSLSSSPSLSLSSSIASSHSAAAVATDLATLPSLEQTLDWRWSLPVGGSTQSQALAEQGSSSPQAAAADEWSLALARTKVNELGVLNAKEKTPSSVLFEHLLNNVETAKAADTLAANTPIYDDLQTKHAASHQTLLGGRMAVNSPTLMPIHVRFGQAEWAGMVAERTAMMAAQRISSAELQLDPPELGQLQVRVSVHNEQASVVFHAPNNQVRDALDQNLSRLRELFEQQGIDLVDVDVSDQSAQEQNLSRDERGDTAVNEDEADHKKAEANQGLEVMVKLEGGIDHYA